MKKLMIKLFVITSLLFAAHASYAEESDVKILKLINPAQSIGIHTGDVLHRSIALEVKPPYQISKNAFPLKGINVGGLELAEITVQQTQHGDQSRYQLDLSYQVFSHTNMPTVMQLPAEKFVLTGGPKALSIEIPAWRFWFSPLVSVDIHQAIDNLQPQQPTPLLNISNPQNWFILYVGIFIIGLAGILYINADKRWLPFMGGAFAQAHRQIKRLPKTPEQERKALVYLHQAFNKVNGENLFAPDIDKFVRSHTGFSKLKGEIEAFFDTSNQSLFSAQQHDSKALIERLVVLSRALRDCERGVR